MDVYVGDEEPRNVVFRSFDLPTRPRPEMEVHREDDPSVKTSQTLLYDQKRDAFNSWRTGLPVVIPNTV